MKKTLKLAAFALMLALLLTLLPATAFAEGTQQTLTDFVVTNANLNLQPGQVTDLDAFFTAAVPEDAGYKIDCEFWRYWGDGAGVVYLYNLPEVNEENKQEEYPCYFDTFEAGKAYWYSIALTPKDPDALPLETDPDKIRLTINGRRVPSWRISVGEDHVTGRQVLLFNLTTITVSIPTGNEVTDFVLDGAILGNLPAGEITDPAALFAGSVPEDAAYELFLEYWMDPDGKAIITNDPAYNSYLDENGKLLTAFEIGKTYRYSVLFTSKDQKTDVLTKDCSSARLTLNGMPVDLSGEYCVETDALGQSVLFHNIRSYTVRDPNEITDFAVENATLSLQPGAAPIDDPGKLFTGKAPDGAAYILEWELWYCIEDHTSFTSSRPGNEERRALNMLLTSFEPGKTYVYYVRLALRDGEGIHLPANQRDIRLTLNGQLVDKRYVTMDSFNKWVYGNEPVSITLPAQSGGGTSFIEPDYYPDYSENEDVAPAAAPAPAAPGRDESDTAPKTADAPILPTLLLTAFAALALTFSAKKRLCK